MRRKLTDPEWERLLPLLPSQKPRVGRPAKDHRIAINAILWILRTGAPSRDLPRAYGSWKTGYSRWVSAVIPRRQGQGRGRHFDRQAYRQRNRMERLINRLKQFWRIATRNEKRAANYLAMLTLAAILLWL